MMLFRMCPEAHYAPTPPVSPFIRRSDPTTFNPQRFRIRVYRIPKFSSSLFGGLITMPFVPNGTLTFCSDFGTADGYAAAMKGQALRVEPELQIMDISHDIPPWDIRRAAFALWTSLPVFPSGTVHVVVIDPGVGTERRSLVAIAGDQVIVAPDNGLISLLCRRFPSMEVYELTIPPESALSLSATFHGRDVYAPTGARIAAGALSVPGGMSPLSNPVLFDCGYVSEAEQVRGSVVCADRFGNIITSIPWSCVSAPPTGCRAD